MDVNANVNNNQITAMGSARLAENSGRTAQVSEAPTRAVPSPRSLEVARVALTRETPNRDYNLSASDVHLREEEINDQMLDNAFAEANRAIPDNTFSLSYGVHEATNRIMISIYSRETEELIRELPPETRLDTYARISEFVGLLFDSNI